MYIVWLLFYAIGGFLFVSILIIVDLLFILFLLLYFRRSNGLLLFPCFINSLALIVVTAEGYFLV